jgi:glycosyltransferase 2 family protein
LRSWWIRGFWIVLILGLLAWVLLAAPLAEIWSSLKQLHLWQIITLLAISLIAILFITLRWWFVVHAENTKVPFVQLMGYRLAAFGMSYFTPGPQVGGEPLQILYLRRNHQMTYARSTSTVIMDKLFEFLVNVIFLAAGLFVIIGQGLFPLTGNQLLGGLVPLLLIILVPPGHLVLLYFGKYPIASLARVIQNRVGRKKPLHLMTVSERMAGIFMQRHPWAMLSAILASALAWTCMWVEYWLMARFILVDLTLWQALAGMTLLQIAFMFPLPAGLGAMEASQVFVMGALGFPPAAGLTMSLLMRGRDMLIGGLGLLRAGRL